MVHINIGSRHITVQGPQRPSMWDMLGRANRRGITGPMARVGGRMLGFGTRPTLTNPGFRAGALRMALRGNTRRPWERQSLPIPHFEPPNLDWRRMRDWRPAVDVWQLLAAFAMGAAVMYLLDPEMGKRRRKMTVQRTSGMTRRAMRGLSRAGRRVGTDMAGKRRALLHGRRDGSAPLDDATLAHKVESMLFRDPHVPKGNININAEHGVVVIRGEVQSPDEIRDIERRVERIDGVQGVRSMLHVANAPAP